MSGGCTHASGAWALPPKAGGTVSLAAQNAPWGWHSTASSYQSHYTGCALKLAPDAPSSRAYAAECAPCAHAWRRSMCTCMEAPLVQMAGEWSAKYEISSGKNPCRSACTRIGYRCTAYGSWCGAMSATSRRCCHIQLAAPGVCIKTSPVRPPPAEQPASLTV